MNNRESYIIVEMGENFKDEFKPERLIRFASFDARHEKPKLAIRRSSMDTFYKIIFTVVFLIFLVYFFKWFLHK